jgi:hypothetical protein
MGSFFRQLEPEFEIANDPIGTLLLGENLLRRSVGGVHVGGCLSGLWLPPHVERRKLSRTTNTRCGWKCPIQYTGIMPPTCNTSDSARNERNEQTNNWCGWDCASRIFFKLDSCFFACAERNHASGWCRWKVLESCSRTEDVITYENNRCGVCQNNRCGVCRCLPLARLWTTPIDVGCAVASHWLVYGRLQ